MGIVEEIEGGSVSLDGYRVGVDEQRGMANIDGVYARLEQVLHLP